MPYDRITDLPLCRACDAIGHGCQMFGGEHKGEWCPKGHHERHACADCGQNVAMPDAAVCIDCATETAMETLTVATDLINKLSFLPEGRDALIPHMDKLSSGAMALTLANTAADNANEAAREIAVENV